jgi:hypothetical protein
MADRAHVRESLRIYAGTHALSAYDRDARALRVYRIIERATLIAGSYSGDLVRHEALLAEKAAELVAKSPELGEGL